MKRTKSYNTELSRGLCKSKHKITQRWGTEGERDSRRRELTSLAIKLTRRGNTQRMPPPKEDWLRMSERQACSEAVRKVSLEKVFEDEARGQKDNGDRRCWPTRGTS